jgi:hypothetical protein
MSKKRKHTTTKNTMRKPPVTKLALYTLDVNGKFTLVTDITDPKVFDQLYKEWFDHPRTIIWNGESLMRYIKYKLPNGICLFEEDYKKIIKGKNVIPATQQEWEAENN